MIPPRLITRIRRAAAELNEIAEQIEAENDMIRFGLGILGNSPRGSGAVTPVADLSVLAVSAQEMDGDVPLSYTLDTDSDVHFVLTLVATKPTAAQITAGQDNLGATAPESFTSALTSAGSPINAAITSTTLDDDYYIHAVVDGGADGDVITASGSPVTIDTTVASELLHAVLTNPAGSRDTTSTTTPTLTLDLSTYSIGDRLVIQYSNKEYPTGLTIDGSATGVTKLSADNGASSFRISAYTKVLVASDISAGIDIVATIGTAAADHQWTVVRYYGAASVVDTYDNDYSGPGALVSLAVTPTNADNILFGLGYGRPNAMVGGFVWDGLTQASVAQYDGYHEYSYATQLDAGVSLQTNTVGSNQTTAARHTTHIYSVSKV